MASPQRETTPVEGGFPNCADQLSLQKCIGRGFFGEVWQADAKVRGVATTFAVKKVRLSLISEHRLTEQLQREISILYSLKHPRCVSLFFDFSDDRYMYLGLEFANGGSLFDKLNAARKFPSDVAARYFLETCEALDYLHHLPEKVIHRDIKPENILLDSEDHIKLADFGWANLLEEANKRTTFCGTLDYLPPEMIMGTGHDESVDMWNMGVLLYELTTGQSPFGSTNGSKEDTCRMILAVDLRFATNYDADARDLVAKLCIKVPAQRLPVREAMKHRFVTRFNGQQATADSAFPSLNIEADVRPSVMARRLSSERDKNDTQMQRLLQAKQQTEDDLLAVQREFEETHKASQEERKKCAEIEADCAKMESSCNVREKELVELRKRKEELEAEASKMMKTGSDGGSGWFSRFAKPPSSPQRTTKPSLGGYRA